jgi:hypothetical protein
MTLHARVPLNPDLIRKVFDKTMDLFFQHELQEVLEGVNERNNCGRMSIYMQQVAHEFGLTNYFADTEYNRKQNGAIKTILDGQSKVVSINCDLLLHSRGQIVDEDNLIAVEVKKGDAPNDEKEKDRERLQALTKASYDDVWSNDGVAPPEHVCGYALGVFVELDRARRVCRFEFYRQGQIFEVSDRAF